VDVAKGDGSGVALVTCSIAFTFFGFKKVTMPLRRYQIPSLVSQAVSASMLAPSVSRMITGPRLSFPSPPVEIGLELNSTRAASARGEAEGVALGEADGSGVGLAPESSEGREGKSGCMTLEFDDDSLDLS